MTQNLVAEYTNACTCVTYDDDSGQWNEAPECWGDCWECQLDDFLYVSQELLESSTTFKIDGFPTWYGATGGIFDASNAQQLLLAITPRNTEWELSLTVENNCLTGVLSHHDGVGTITVTPIIE